MSLAPRRPLIASVPMLDGAEAALVPLHHSLGLWLGLGYEKGKNKANVAPLHLLSSVREKKREGAI